ncbi:MAG: c-type cytochrome [Elusimicrobiota bacterium]
MNALLTLILAVNAAAQAPAAPAKTDAAKMFATKCSACHAKDGKGSLPMAKMFKLKDPTVLNLASEGVQKDSDEALVKVIVEGRGKMPVFKGKLKDADITALVAFIRGLAAAPAVPAAPAAK